MTHQAIVACRADFVLPLAQPDPGQRIADGYVLAQGETLLEVGPYTAAVGERLRATYGDAVPVPDGDIGGFFGAVLLAPDGLKVWQ